MIKLFKNAFFSKENINSEFDYKKLKSDFTDLEMENSELEIQIKELKEKNEELSAEIKAIKTKIEIAKNTLSSI